ncbi:hypothetical protein N2W54_000733 [Lotmaria passim]
MSSYDTQEPSGGTHRSLDLIGDVDLDALQVLESNVDFMSLFYCHLAACPPHGSFAYYSAMTLVERAKRRYSAAAAAAPSSHAESNEIAASVSVSGGASTAAGASAPLPPGVYPVDGAGASAVLCALSIPNVLALIDKRYDTRHLSSWPLLYVPAEIRGADVAALMQQQQPLQP